MISVAIGTTISITGCGTSSVSPTRAQLTGGNLTAAQKANYDAISKEAMGGQGSLMPGPAQASKTAAIASAQQAKGKQTSTPAGP